jgi:hypothetical protein
MISVQLPAARFFVDPATQTNLKLLTDSHLQSFRLLRRGIPLKGSGGFHQGGCVDPLHRLWHSRSRLPNRKGQARTQFLRFFPDGFYVIGLVE